MITVTEHNGYTLNDTWSFRFVGFSKIVGLQHFDFSKVVHAILPTHPLSVIFHSVFSIRGRLFFLRPLQIPPGYGICLPLSIFISLRVAKGVLTYVGMH